MGITLLLTACASQQPILAPLLSEGVSTPAVELQETPFFPQQAYQCGPAALATVLQESDVQITPEDLVAQVYLPKKQGSFQLELVAAARGYNRLPYLISPNLTALLAELRIGRPVLVLQNLGFNSYPIWHYAVVVGFIPDSDRIILRSGTNKREILAAARFIKTWERADFWGLVILRPGEMPASVDRDAYLKSAAAMEATGHSEAALKVYAAASTRWPKNDVARLGLGNAYYAQGEYAKAEATYRQLLALHPSHPVGHNNLAQVLFDQTCYDSALAVIDTALNMDDNLQLGFREVLAKTRREILDNRQLSSSPMPEHCRKSP